MYFSENSGSITTAILFSIVLAVCVAIFTAVILFLLVAKVKLKVKAKVLKLARKTTRESDYEDIRHHSLPPEIIDTSLTENIAYGCTSNKQSVAAATNL